MLSGGKKSYFDFFAFLILSFLFQNIELKIQNKKNTKKGKYDAEEEKKADKFLFGVFSFSDEEGENDDAIADYQQGNKKGNLATRKQVDLSENEISDACDDDSEEEPVNEDDILKAEVEFYAENNRQIACLRASAGIRQRANLQDLKKKEQLKLIRNQLNFKV